MYTEDNCPHFSCGSCIHFKVNADRAGIASACKRIDHKKVKFAIPWYMSYDCGQRGHVVCADFVPKLNNADSKLWTGFEDYWNVYRNTWLPYGNENITLPFTINGNTEVSYRVPLKLFLNGTMIEDGVLQATEKVYYKQFKRSKEVPTGYRLMREPIDGVSLD